MLGDPTYLRLQQAIQEGALPFTCQGSENGLAIEGGKTLGYEIVSQLSTDGRLDRLVIQVGGGALASSVIQGLRDAVALGRLPSVPRIHTVQTEGAYPLKRAYEAIVGDIAERLRVERDTGSSGLAGTRERAEFVRRNARSPAVAEALRYAATHRSQFMWPWEV